MAMMQTRRRFLAGISLAGAAGLVRAPPSLAAEGALETTTLRIGQTPAICLAPQYISDELLRAEGFTDIRYVKVSPIAIGEAIGRGEADFSGDDPIGAIRAIVGGAPIVVLTGIQVGCYDLFAQQDIRRISELKGRRAATDNPWLFDLIAAQVGLDPAADLDMVTGADSSFNPVELFAQGKIDAYLGFPPGPQELHVRGIGHVLLSTVMDRPWSQYFCCMLMGNQEFVRNHPVATKRALRAILKATDLCASQPERAARSLVDGGFAPRYDYAVQTLSDVPFDKWREYDPEDTVRYYGLRLHEIGRIKSIPQEVIAQNTDWRFLNELKHELKA